MAESAQTATVGTDPSQTLVNNRVEVVSVRNRLSHLDLLQNPSLESQSELVFRKIKIA